MLIATRQIWVVSLFIIMAQTPVEVDLTNDTPPHWTTQGATTPPAATTAAAEPTTCAICLQDIHREAIGPNAPYDCAACSHPIHLRCAMEHVAHQTQPACPTCRQQWTQEGQHRLEQLGQTNQVPWAVPETPHDTRNFHNQPPPAPDQPILLCCPRLALINHHHPEQDTSWRELPTRHMEWAPTLHRTTNEWQPEWVCLRCNTAVTPNDLTIDADEPAPICPFHGPRRLAIDVRHNERGWVCSRGLPPHILQCEPTRINTPAPPSTAADGHPTTDKLYPTQTLGSTFHCFLPHLHPDAADAWRVHRHAGPEWQDLVTQLRRAPAMPWQRLHHTLQMLQQIALDTGHRLPAAETALVEQLVTAGSREPTGAQIHFPWAMNILTQSSGYVPATAQEALLQNFLGERQASHAASMAERWRQQTRPATPPHNHPSPPATEARPAHTRRPPSPPTDSNSTTSSTSSSTDTTSSSTPTARAPTPQAPQQPPPAPETTSPDERRLHIALATLDDIDLFATLQQKCLFFQTPPQFIRGRVRQALSYALHNINTAPSQQGQSRAWKLCLLFPWMLLHRPPGVRTLSKDGWPARIEQFQKGQWIQLLSRAHHQAQAITPNSSPEQELQDPTRRPPEPYAPLHPSLSEFQPDQPVDLPDDLILMNLRRARKGAAPPVRPHRRYPPHPAR